MADIWGWHLALGLKDCNIKSISNPDNIKAWGRELVPAIGMVSYGEPMVEHFATQKEETAGYSYLQLIETSNVAAHFAEKLGQVYIDIFSCKKFDPEIAIEISRRYFDAGEAYERSFFERGTFREVYHVIDPVIQSLNGSMGRAA